jgi:RNA polymerase sigma-70 factor (ECF subfamily)
MVELPLADGKQANHDVLHQALSETSIHEAVMGTPENLDDQPLLNSCRSGDEHAARELFDNYAERLLALVRRRLSQRLCSRVDPEDVVQSVFRTFFRRARQGQFSLKHEDALGKLLVRIALRKTLSQVAFHHAALRDPRLEIGNGQEGEERLRELRDPEPTPDEAAAFLDQFEHFLSLLKPLERQVVELRLQGYGTEEIAVKLDTYDRKIRRILERVRGLAEQAGWSP